MASERSERGVPQCYGIPPEAGKPAGWRDVEREAASRKGRAVKVYPDFWSGQCKRTFCLDRNLLCVNPLTATAFGHDISSVDISWCGLVGEGTKDICQ